jgi:hypothetical protein
MSNRWVIKVLDENRVDLLRSGRQVRAEVSPTEAKRYLKAHAAPGDVAFTEDQTGYRTRLSPRQPRRRKR